MILTPLSLDQIVLLHNNLFYEGYLNNGEVIRSMCKLNEVEIVDTFEEFMSKINRKRELEHKLRHNNEKIYDRYKACDLKSYEFMTTLCSDGFYMFEKGYINPDLIYDIFDTVSTSSLESYVNHMRYSQELFRVLIHRNVKFDRYTSDHELTCAYITQNIIDDKSFKDEVKYLSIEDVVVRYIVPILLGDLYSNNSITSNDTTFKSKGINYIISNGKANENLLQSIIYHVLDNQLFKSSVINNVNRLRLLKQLLTIIFKGFVKYYDQEFLICGVIGITYNIGPVG